ncbi:MAG: glucose-6-phosphate isomerase [Rhodospirillaceae bacterium]|nr:glucose-6-phosphate isomerase [Rhodospirillaceae bacterium]
MTAKTAMSDITKSNAWTRLEAHREEIASATLSDMFIADDERASRLSWELDGLNVDLSRQRLTTDTLDLLMDLARAADVEARRDAMFAGQPINPTEDRAVLHVALRDETGLTGVGAEAKIQRQTMIDFADAIRAGAETGATGQAFCDVVNIGIGGSHQGPMVATTALANSVNTPRVHYVANVDGTDLSTALRGLDPATTLILVASKTFTTAETMTNANSARAWLTSALGDDAVAQHFCALSTNEAAAGEFGIPAARVFPFADWVGGRFSLWSSIGLSTALAVGGAAFEQLLSGAHAMDRHFSSSPLGENLPVLLAVTDLWNRIFLDLPVRAVLPYDERLRHLPAHLQQLEMESNGKGVTLSGEPVSGPPASVIFGATGTNGQHSFHQLLHQGPALVAAEFIAVAMPGHDLAGHHDILLANMLAQAQALANGTADPETPHHHCPGNRPSTVILLKTLDPYRLGMLLALYEHKVMAEGAIWNINSFDQFGVQLGKALSGPVLSALKGDSTPNDPATAAALAKLRAWRS